MVENIGIRFIFLAPKPYKLCIMVVLPIHQLIIMYLQKKRNRFLPWIIVPVFVFCLFWLMKQLSSVLAPFLIAAILGYILNPIVTKLTHKNIKRGHAAMLVMLLCFLAILLLFLIVVPMLITQTNALLDHIPSLLAYVREQALPWVNEKLGKSYSLDSQTLTIWVQNNADGIRRAVQGMMPSIAQSSGKMISVAINLLLLPFLLYYFLLDWQKWQESIARMIPRRWIGRVTEIAEELDDVLGQFLRGQLTVMLIMGFLYGTGLSLVGLKSGFAIGMLAGLLGFVPYLGAFIGIALATVAALLQFDHFGSILTVWLVFVIGQPLEGYILTPRLVGERIGLSPMAVIFALMAFGELMGFTGMLLALPMAAITLVLARELLQVYYGSSFYSMMRSKTDKLIRSGNDNK